MKVGIMSMQRIINNGSFLQSYSLMKNIEKLGHQVEFVDYEVGEPLVRYKDGNDKTLSEKMQENCTKIKDRVCRPRKKKRDLLNQEYDYFAQNKEIYLSKMIPMLHLSEEPNYTPELDALVIGSDEVFNCLQPNPAVGYSKQLFGAQAKAPVICSYAGSFGNTSLEGLRQHHIEQEVAGFLKEFKAVSVRDKNSRRIVKELTGVEPEYHVDPVFLYDYKEEMPQITVEKPYIVVYAYDGRITQKEAKAIQKFADKQGKEIICLCGVQNYFGHAMVADPFEVLSYVKFADYVITDTFHGSVFSIKFNKKFASFARKGEGAVYGNNNKMEDLLGRFGLSDHMVNDVKDLEKILTSFTDFDKVNRIIQKECRISQSYLQKVLASQDESYYD